MNCKYPDSELQSKVRAFIDASREDILNDLSALVRIPSVRGESAPNAPFGEGPAAALEAASALLERCGFEVQRHPQYGYSVSPAVKGSEDIGLFCHCDTVGVNGVWLYAEPFEPVVKDGWLYGRGVKDDKGGVINALYAVLALKNAGVQLRHGIRLVLGSNEETGMKDMEYFAENETMPRISLVPDCEFPVCWGEKSYFDYRAEAPRAFENILDFNSGSGRGSVCSEIRVVLRAGDALRAELKAASAEVAGSELTEDADGNCVLLAHGVSVHACTPQNGLQAGGIATEVLLRCPSLGENDLTLLAAMDEVFHGVFGEPFGLEFFDKDFKENTFAITAVYLKDGRPCLESYPHYAPHMTIDGIWSAVKAWYEAIGWSIELLDNDLGFTVGEEDREMLSVLNDTFIELRGGKEKDIYITRSGTYARKLKNAYATGIEVPKTAVFPSYFPQGHGLVHQPDECIPVEALMDGIEMTAMMLLALDGALE